MTDNNPRSRTWRTEALVIARRDFNEADRIVTLYTPDHGSIRVIAKGVRKPTSHLGPHLELFNRSLVGLARGRTMDTLTAVSTIETRPLLRTDLMAFSYACHCAEVLLSLAAEGQGNPAAYQAISRALRSIADGFDPQIVSRHFELLALSAFGFKPDLLVCVNCRQPLQAVVNYLSPNAGGLLCANCRDLDRSAKPVAVNVQKVWRTLLRDGLAGGLRLTIDPVTRRETEAAMLGYLRIVTERDFRSLVVLGAMQPV